MHAILGAVYTAIVFVCPPNYSVESSVIADFNGDGNADYMGAFIAYSLEGHLINTAGPVVLFLGDGSGGFADGTKQVFGPAPVTSLGPYGLATADFNRDGHTDVYLADWGLDIVNNPNPGYPNKLFLSDARGHLRLTEKSVLGAIRDSTNAASVGDIDGDGDLDILVYNYGDVFSYFLINDGHGKFARSTTRLAPPYDTSSPYWSMTLADMNHDGFPDLVLGGTDRSQANGGTDSVILMNDGAGNFGNPVALPPKPYPGGAGEAMDVDAVDINEDGRLDILITYTNGQDIGLGHYMQFLIQGPLGNFVDETANILPGQSLNNTLPVQVHSFLTDMNGDGHLDIVASAQDGAAVYLNDGKGHFRKADVMPSDSGYQVAVGDLNGDGLADLVWEHFESDTTDKIVVSMNVFRAGPNKLLGNARPNTLKGFGGDDTIKGFGGADRIYGGFGRDTLVGGADADTFFYTSIKDSLPGIGRDAISDFRHAQGDRIDLSAIDADTRAIGRQPFVFIGAENFTRHRKLHPHDKGMVRYAGGVLQGAINGHTTADFEIGLAGSPKVTGVDIVP